MRFFSAIKSSLGFGPSPDEVDDLLTDTAPADASPTTSDSNATGARTASEPVKVDEQHREAIFNHVVQVFNEALPGFIADSIDNEAQKRRLYDSLDAGLKEYIDNLTAETRTFCNAEWQSKHDSLAREMAELRRRSEEVEHRAAEFKQQQLSADRQKRALTERVNDLEHQRATLEAEREQYELENRSLMSRLKAAGVHSDDLAKLQAEADDLRKQLNEALNNPDSAVARARESYN